MDDMSDHVMSLDEMPQNHKQESRLISPNSSPVVPDIKIDGKPWTLAMVYESQPLVDYIRSQWLSDWSALMHTLPAFEARPTSEPRSSQSLLEIYQYRLVDPRVNFRTQFELNPRLTLLTTIVAMGVQYSPQLEPSVCRSIYNRRLNPLLKKAEVDAKEPHDDRHGENEFVTAVQDFAGLLPGEDIIPLLNLSHAFQFQRVCVLMGLILALKVVNPGKLDFILKAVRPYEPQSVEQHLLDLSMKASSAETSAPGTQNWRALVEASIRNKS